MTGPGVLVVERTNSLATASLVLSLCSMFCGVTFIPGIIVGHIALHQIKQTGAGGRGLAIAGLVIGYCILGAIVALVFLAGLWGVF